MIRAHQLFVTGTGAVAILFLLLAPTAQGLEVHGMEVNMRCDREAYDREHCTQRAYKGTEKTADELMLETFGSCADDATKKWFQRKFLPLDVSDDDEQIFGSSAVEEAVREKHGPLRNLVGSAQEERNLPKCMGCISCHSACCLLGYCAGTCGCGCSCNRRRSLQEEEGEISGFRSEFIELMEGVEVQTSHVEHSLASSCTSAVKRLAEKMEAYGNRCMGDYTKIKCFATAFT